MSDKTIIEWTDATWNPVRGCSPVSEGCRNCYAERMAGRFCAPGGTYDGLISTDGKWTGHVWLVPDILSLPWKWKKPRRIFVNSMSDLFHPAVPDAFIEKIILIMFQAPQHTFQILTKRPKRMREIFSSFINPKVAGKAWPLPNVWLGVSVENQAAANERIPILLHTPAAVRFVSCEPLLGPVDLASACFGVGNPRPSIEIQAGQLSKPLTGLDWVIAGGETGPGARPMFPNWVRGLRDQCQASEVPFFFKGWGEFKPMGMSNGSGQVKRLGALEDLGMIRSGKKISGRILDGRTWGEFPK